MVSGGGPSLDGARWIACRKGFFLPVRILSRLFRRLFLAELYRAFDTGSLVFCGDLAGQAQPAAFARWLDTLRRLDWVIYAKPPFGGPKQVLAYLGHYTHRVAIANSRLLAFDEGTVRFTWKDYRRGGKTKVMALEAFEFIRRFLLHTLPDGFHRIRHYGFLANGARTERLARCRRLLDVPVTSVGAESPDAHDAHQLTWRDFAVCPRVWRRDAARRQCAALDRPVSLRHFMSPIQRLSSSINIVCGRSSRRHALRRALVRFEALLQQRCSRSSCPMMPPRRSMPNRHAANNVLGRFPDPAAAMTQALSP